MAEPRILLIDDDASHAEIAGESLERAGHHVTLAHSGDEGLRKFREGEFDVVLTDLRLPDTDGMQVLKRIKALGADPQEWGRRVISDGFAALEAAMAARAGRYAFGDTVTLADVYLVPQMYNARRFDVPLEAYPTLTRVEQALTELEAFRRAHPDVQPDAEVASN